MLRGEVLMSGSGPAVVNQTLSEQPETEAVDTRFGKVTIQRRRPIRFLNGMLGMPDKVQFCLANMPSEKFARFKLLQSIEDLSLAFITLPVDLKNPIVERGDLEQAAKELDIPLNDLAVLLIVSVHREPDGVRLSVNARAPVLMHANARTATQYVFHHTKYQIRQPLAW